MLHRRSFMQMAAMAALYGFFAPVGLATPRRLQKVPQFVQQLQQSPGLRQKLQ